MVSKFLSFLNRHQNLNCDELLKNFLDYLRGKKCVANWQVRQAVKTSRHI